MKKLQLSFILLQIESVITSVVFVMPVSYLLFSDIGLSQFQIGLSQAIFMAAALLLDIPTGWIADRFSRKMSNIIGDVLMAIGFILYAKIHSFTGVIVAEILIGSGQAFTNGADVGLLKSYAKALKKDYKKVSARLATIKPIAELLGALIGGYAGAHLIRTPFYMTGGLYVLGALLSMFIVEIGVRRITDKHPLRDMADITSYSMRRDRGLKWRILASAYAANITHTTVWLFTPMLILSGVQFGWYGYAWALSMVFASLGGLLAHRYMNNLTIVWRIGLPAILSVASYLIMGLHLSFVTIWLCGIFGMTRGWYSAIMGPIVQQHIPDDIQSTVISVASVMRRAMYIPLVALVNFLGNKSISTALLGSVVIYGLLGSIIVQRMRRYEA